MSQNAHSASSVITPTTTLGTESLNRVFSDTSTMTYTKNPENKNITMTAVDKPSIMISPQ